MKVDTSNNLSGANLCQTNVQCPAIQESKSSQSSASLVVRTYGYDIPSTYAHVVLDFGEPGVHRVKEVISMEQFGGGSTERYRSALHLHPAWYANVKYPNSLSRGRSTSQGAFMFLILCCIPTKTFMDSTVAGVRKSSQSTYSQVQTTKAECTYESTPDPVTAGLFHL